MRIAFITPGFGDAFYCQNCFRDMHIINELRDMGHEVLVIPMYLPHTLSGEFMNENIPVFYGAIGVYLKQIIPFKKIPKIILNILNSKPLLTLASRFSGATDSPGLEDLTIDILLGDKGKHAEELDKLANYIKHEVKADIIHLSNALLLGLASKIKSEKTAVVCVCQDEDSWIEAMDKRHEKAAWEIMAIKAEDVCTFIAVSENYASIIKSHIHPSKTPVCVAPVGLNLNSYKKSTLPQNPPVFSFLSRLSPATGFNIFIEAYILLKKEFPNLILKATGGATSSDKKSMKPYIKRLKKLGYIDSVYIDEAAYRKDKVSFLASSTILSVPIEKGEAFGTYLIEAMASGVPVIQPKSGGFTEIIEKSGGGILYEGKGAKALAENVSYLLKNPTLIKTLSDNGYANSRKYFSSKIFAQRLLDIYNDIKKQF